MPVRGVCCLQESDFQVSYDKLAGVLSLCIWDVGLLWIMDRVQIHDWK